MPRKNRVRLYQRGSLTDFWDVHFVSASRPIPPFDLDLTLLRSSKSGLPWECWFALCILAVAKKHPELFPHDVIDVYVMRSIIYIVTRKKNGSPTHAVRYRHDSGPVTKVFDKTGAAGVKAYYHNDPPPKLSLSPSKPRQDGTRKTSERGKIGSRPGTRTHQQSHGAWLRAKDAGFRFNDKPVAA